MSSPRSSPPTTGAFASVLRRHRESAGLTQSELADRAGLGVRTVSNLERGINASPYPSTVRLLADALELGADARSALLAAAGRRTGTLPTGGYLGAVPPTRLVARQEECAAITAALTAVAAGEGQVVLLAGEPGIGKTRLAQEASLYAAERGFLVASGRCYEQQSDRPFVPVLEVVAALEHKAVGLVPEGIATRWPALSALFPDGVPLDQPAAPDAEQVLHRQATSLVRELARHQPVAILFDDLHWADDPTLQLLIHLARHTTADRVLLLGTYRGAEVGGTHPVRRLAHSLQRERLTRTVDVARFDRETTAGLIDLRLGAGAVPRELVDLVHVNSEGNPFFAVEILTALIERGDLTQVDGRWVVRELAGVEAPVSVSEAVGERFVRLSAAAQELLEAASVLGAVFDPDDVAHSLDDSALETAFDEAEAAGLLAVDEDRYAFDHSLTQQALYAALSPVRRRRLHRAAGELLATRAVAIRRRRAAEIAKHLELGGLSERALPFAVVAGEVAAGASAFREAVRLYGQARELAEEVGDEATLTTTLERIGQVEVTAGRYDEALTHLLEAAARYRRDGDGGARLRVEGMLADLQHRRGEGEAAAARLDDVLAELGTDTDTAAAGGAELALGLARVRLYLGQHQRCIEASELAIRLARTASSAAAEAEACAVGGTALLFLDRPDEALRVLEQGAGAAAAIDAPVLESGCLLGLQWATTMRGELARSREIGERGWELTRQAGNSDLESQHLAGLGRTAYCAGDFAEARRHLELSVDLTRNGSPTLFSGIPPVYLGQLLAAQGDVAGATACYDEAATAPDLQTFAFAGYLQAGRAQLDLRAGDAGGALARLEPWLADEAPTKVHDMFLQVVAADACLALGDTARAEELLARALRRAEATRHRVEQPDALRLLARCHRLAGRDSEAQRCRDEALALAAALGLNPALERLRAETP